MDIEDLPDEYNLFLYRGQGWQIKALRDGMGLTQLAFSKFHGIDSRKVNLREGDKVKITKGTWEKLLFMHVLFKP